MAANRKIRREFDLDEFEEQALEAFDQVPGLKLNLRNGDSVTIPHPLLLGDEQQALVERVQRREDEDRDENGKPNGNINGQPAEAFVVRLAKAILGEEEHARFLAGGGSSNKVSLAWQYLTRELPGPKSTTTPAKS